MEKNNPSNPLWTPCKSLAIPRLSRSSESNLGRKNFRLRAVFVHHASIFSSILVREKHWALSEHFSDFLGETEHFSGKNGALRWSILVGKQKHNVQKPISWSIEQNARDTQMTTRVTGEARKTRDSLFFFSGCRPRFSRLEASPLKARARVHSPH